MSLMASAHRSMKTKGKKEVLSPRSNASPGGSSCNDNINMSNEGFFKQQQQHHQAPVLPYGHDGSSPVIATVNKSQYRVSGGSPPSHTQQMHSQQQIQHQHDINNRRGYVDGGMNYSPDTRGEYDQWQQQQQPRAPSPQYHHSQPYPPHPSQMMMQQQQQQPPYQQHQHNSYQQQQVSPHDGGNTYINNNGYQQQQYPQGGNQGYRPSPHQPHQPPQVGRIPSRPRRQYDSFTKSPSEEKHEHKQKEQAFDPFASSPVNVPNNHTAAGYRANSPMFQNEALAAPHQNKGVGKRREQSPQQAMLDDNANNFVYDIETEPVLAAHDFEYHTEKDEESAFDDDEVLQPLNDDGTPPSNLAGTVNNNDNQTVSSEHALQGTPVKKKHQGDDSVLKTKRRHKGESSKSKVIIDNVEDQVVHDNYAREESISSSLAGVGINESNVIPEINRVGSGGDGTRKNPRYAIHQNDNDGGDEDEEESSISNNRQLATHKMRDIAAHARKFATDASNSAESSASESDLPPTMPSSSRHAPQRDDKVVKSSWESKDDGKDNFGWGDDNAWGEIKKGSGSGSVEQGGKQPKYAKEDNNNNNIWADENNIAATFGTWGDQAGGTTTNNDGFGGNEGGSSKKENAKALEEWDKAEAEWREKSVKQNDEMQKPMPPLMSTTAAAATKSHPWKSNESLGFAEFEPDSTSLFGSVGGKEVDIRHSESASALSGPGAEEETDDDSIFEFDKGRKKKNTESENNPSDIFNKINRNLKTSRRALGQPTDSDALLDADRVAQHAGIQLSKSEASSALEEETKKKSISFVPETKNTVHTYVSAAESVSTKGTRSTYSSADDGKQSSVPLSEKIGRSADGRPQSLFPNYHHNDDDQDESTKDGSIETYGDSTLDSKSTYKSGYSHDDASTRRDDDEELNILDQVGLGIGSIAASLGGLFAAGQQDGQGQAKAQNGHNDRNRGAPSNGGGNQSVVTEDQESTYAESTAFSTHRTDLTETVMSDDHRTATESAQSSEHDWLGYIGNMIFPSNQSGGDTTIFSGSGTTETGVTETGGGGTTERDQTGFQEDEDKYLLQQAVAAARAIHHVQGVEYDETQDINVMADIKFVVATVALPFGLLFQEHEIGVWVSKVLPNGNASKKGVQHGDQLAAINGTSSVHSTIDEVAKRVSGTPTNMTVELTFLRYVGPLRPMPGSIIQEGFEVTDTAVSPKRNMPKVKRGMFSKKKNGGTPLASSPGRRSSPGRIFGSKAAASQSPKYTQSPLKPPSSNGTNASSSPGALPRSPGRGGTTRTTSAGGAPTIPSLGATTPVKKKNKSLGKIMSFKKKT